MRTTEREFHFEYMNFLSANFCTICYLNCGQQIANNIDAQSKCFVGKAKNSLIRSDQIYCQL